MNLRYVRVDQLLRCLTKGLNEIDGVRSAASDIENQLKSGSSLSTSFKGLVVMLQCQIEDVIRELSRLILFGFPEKLPKNSLVKLKEIADQKDWIKLRQKLVDRQLRDRSYSPFLTQIDYLVKLINVDLPDNIQEIANSLQELSATRNVIIHSGGKADAKYFEFSGDKARVQKDRNALSVDYDYLASNCKNAEAFLQWLTSVIGAKFKRYTKSTLIRDTWSACFDSRLRFEDWWIVDNKGEIRGLRVDNPSWRSASRSERSILALFSLFYTGRVRYPEDITLYALDDRSFSCVSELISAFRLIFD